MTHPDWLTLERTPTTAYMLLPDPAGGMTLQYLTATEQPGNTFVLTVNAAWELRRFFTNELLSDDVLLELCHLRGLTQAIQALPSQPTTCMSLDEMATILSASGWLVRERTLDEATWRTIGRTEGYQMPITETVAVHCWHADAHRQGVAVEAEIRAILSELGIPPDAPYAAHAAALAARCPARWPDTTQDMAPCHYEDQIHRNTEV